MSWDSTQKHRRSLPSTTMSSMLSASSPTSAPPSLTTSPWTLGSTRGLGRQLQLPPVSGARVWRSIKLSVKTINKMAVYNACVISTLLYGSVVWTTYAGQERRLNTFHLRSIRRILGIFWRDKVTNADVLSRAGLPSMYTLLIYNADCDDWVMSAVWRMVAFQKTSSTMSWLWGEPPAALTCDIKMSA